MKPIRFHPEAQAEMIEAAAWYDARQSGLGKRFLAAIRNALDRIERNPTLYRRVEGDVRRCLTNKFPFGVLFRNMPETIVVMAVMHLHRDPDYWKDRRFEQAGTRDDEEALQMVIQSEL